MPYVPYYSLAHEPRGTNRASRANNNKYVCFAEIPNILPFNRKATYEFAFMNNAPDNEHARDSLNLPPAKNPPDHPSEKPSRPQSRKLHHKHDETPCLPHITTAPSDTETLAPSSDTLSPRPASLNGRKTTMSIFGPKKINPLDLTVGFEWDDRALALFCMLKEHRKKGTTFIAKSGNFPGHTAQSLDKVWAERREEAKVCWREIKGAL